MPNWTQYCGDIFWDDNLTWNTTEPRFTQCFQKTALSWASPIFIVFCIPLLIKILIKPTKSSIQWRFYNSCRQALAVGLATVALIDLILNVINSKDVFPADIVNSVIALFFSLFLNHLFYRMCRLNKPTGGSICFTLLLTILTQALQLFAHKDVLSTQRTIVIIINLILTLVLFFQTFIPDSSLCLNNHSDKEFILESKSVDSEEGIKQKECPKAHATFFSRMAYSWYSPLTYIGWRRSLLMSDVWRIRTKDSAKINYEHYQRNVKCSTNREYFQNGQNKNNKENSDRILLNNHLNKFKSDNHNDLPKINILRIICASFWSYFLPGAIFKLFQDIALFINPMIMKQLMKFVNDNNQQTWHGYAFSIALFLVTSGQILTLNYYFNRMQTFGMRVRTQLTTAVYRKALNLSSGARAKFTTGEIVNFMAVDAQRFVELSSFINLIWSAPLQIIVSLIFLWKELGISVLSGFFFMIILIPINGYLTSLSQHLQVKQMKFKDERVKAMNEMLTGMKIIKLYGWEKAFIKKITNIRGKEIAILRKMNHLNCALIVIWNLAPFLVSLITFALYVTIDKNNILTAEKAFVSLSLFNILRFPLTMLPNLVTNLIMTRVSVQRLNNFLSAKEIINYIKPNCSSSENCIELLNCTFRWSQTTSTPTTDLAIVKDGQKEESFKKKSENTFVSKATLSKININIKPGSFVAIVGPVGSGKSSILNAILGNMELLNGTISVSSKSKIAYTPQEAWIQNSTLRENILFNQPFDERRYRQILQSCSLMPDLEILPGADLTEIGEKGINLSGGQKQRVSLARACYKDADIYLLDDPLAAVDSHVGKYIFENILHSDSGLLRNKTRILVTNNLSVLPSTDTIIVLKDGQVIESGGYRDLIAVKNGHFSNLIQQYSIEQNEKKEQHNDKKSENVEEIKKEESSRDSIKIKKNRPLEISKLIEKENMEIGKVKWSVYGRYMKSITWFWCLVFIANYIVSQTSNVGANLWLSHWSTKTEKGISNSENIMYLLVYGGIGISQGIFSAIGYYGLTKGVLRAAFNLHNQMLHTIMRSSMSFFDVTPLGRILNRFSKDIDICDSTISGNFRILINCLFSALATIIIISIQLNLFLVIVLPMIIAFYYIQKLYVATARQLKRLESTSKSPVFSHFSETLSGVTTIRAYSVTDDFIDKSDRYVDVNNSCYYASLISNRWLSVRLEMVANLIVLTAAAFAVLYRDKLEPSHVGLIITYALNTTQHLNYLVRSSSEVETNIVSVERILEYADLPVEADWTIESHAPKNDWPSKGNLEFKNYSTRYRENLDLVLKDIRLHVKQGEKIGIVGRTGAGKSSLTLALFRLIEPANGTIIIDDVDISKIGLHQLRQHLTIIPQDPILFSGTIRTNLDPFNEKTDQELWNALEMAHLKKFVSSNNEGLEYVISESGNNLSMGQRQLVCLARALLRKSKVLILDEATATVDMETDELIGKTIRSAFADCTIFTIAHRLHTIMDSTKVLVLDNGRVSEFDTPQNLITNSKSIFYSMTKAAGISQAR